MDPILASIIAAAASGIFGTGQTIAANKYNSPRSQLRRLRKAGLPLAFMYQGRVNQQSDVPKLSIDPDLGSVEKEQLGIQRGQLSETQRMNTQEIENLKEQLEKYQMENEEAAGRLKWLKETYPDYQNTGKPERTNQELLLDMDKSIKDSEDWYKRNQARISEIIAVTEEDFHEENGQLKLKQESLNKIVNQVALLASQDRLLGQLYNIRELEEILTKALSDNMEDETDVELGIIWAILKLFDKTKF